MTEGPAVGEVLRGYLGSLRHGLPRHWHHSATFSNATVRAIDGALGDVHIVLDPFAGTGGIDRLDRNTTGIELEPEWADQHLDANIEDSRYGSTGGPAVALATTIGAQYDRRTRELRKHGRVIARRASLRTLTEPATEKESQQMTWLIALLTLIIGFILGWWWSRRSLSVRIEAAEQRARSAESQAESARTSVTEAEAARAEALARATKAEEDAAASAQSAAEAVANAETARAEASAAHTRAEKASEAAAAAHSELKKANARADETAAARDAVEVDLTAAAKRADEAESVAGDLKRQLEQCHADAEADRADAEADRARANEAETALATANAAAEQARADLEAATAEAEAARKDAAQARSEVEAARAALDSARSEVSAVRTDLEAARTDAANAQAEAARAWHSTDAVRSESKSEDSAPSPMHATPTATAANAAAFAPAPAAGAATAETTAVASDDLTRVEGIGPKIAGLLKDAGINSFAALASTAVDAIRRILDDAGPRYRMHDPGTWSRQAGLAAEGRWDDLEQLQDNLSGGR